MLLQGAIRNGAIDRLAIGLSGLCLVHCIASAVLLTVLASAGGLLLDPIIHEVGLMFALALGVIGLGRGILHHGFMLPAAIGSLGLGMMARRADAPPRRRRDALFGRRRARSSRWATTSIAAR